MPRNEKSPVKGEEKRRFWNFVQSKEGEPPELILYGEIGSVQSWWGDRVTPAQFSSELQKLGEIDELVVRINSGGGDVFAANAIYCRLRDMKAKITVKIDGWAASAATIIAMAGDEIQIPKSGIFMIHDPSMRIYETCKAEDFEKMAQELKIIKKAIVETYKDRTGMDETEISDMMAEEKWWTGEEAVEKGFCDCLMFETEPETVIENKEKVIVNKIPINVQDFKTLPNTAYKNRIPEKSEKKPEIGQQKEETMKDGIKTTEDLEKEYPNLCKSIRDEAAKNERERIQNIMESVPAGYEEIRNEAMFETVENAGEVAIRVLAQQKAQSEKYMQGLKRDGMDSGINDIKPGGSPTGKLDEEDVFQKAINEVL